MVQGGSTITQQLAKNLFLTPDRTMGRKIQEAMLALWLERTYSKNQILTAYLNRVYLGAGTYGVDAAAQTYFNKPATEVNLREAAILAGLLKAPSRYSPTTNPDKAAGAGRRGAGRHAGCRLHHRGRHQGDARGPSDAPAEAGGRRRPLFRRLGRRSGRRLHRQGA